MGIGDKVKIKDDIYDEILKTFRMDKPSIDINSLRPGEKKMLINSSYGLTGAMNELHRYDIEQFRNIANNLYDERIAHKVTEHGRRNIELLDVFKGAIKDRSRTGIHLKNANPRFIYTEDKPVEIDLRFIYTEDKPVDKSIDILSTTDYIILCDAF
jgi:hypothetical protein